MRIGTYYARMLVACPSVFLIAVLNVNGHIPFSTVHHPELQEKNAAGQQAEVSEAETKAAKKVFSASDTPAKLKATTEFLKKYPKGTLRSQVAGHLAVKIAEVPDPAQQIALAGEYLNLFKEPVEAEIINPVLINAYIKSNHADDAFRIAATMLAKAPDDVEVLKQMTIVGTQQAQQKNSTYIQQSQTYGARAISLIEADRKPANLDDNNWKEYKVKWLPDLYLSMGILSLSTGKSSEAKVQFQKAVALNPSTPFAYALLGNAVNDEYQQMAQQYNVMPPGQDKEEMLRKSEAKMKEAVDLFAHAAALSEGNAQYQQLHDQVFQDLQSYYKYLHKGSTDGLQALIDKYKKPNTQQ
jgi:hypothetical protein